MVSPRRFQAGFDPGRWIGYFVSGIFAAGLVWGAAGIWLLPQSVPHQTFVAFVLGGMVAGASATFSVRMDAFLAYTVPALAPLAIRFLSMGDDRLLLPVANPAEAAPGSRPKE